MEKKKFLTIRRIMVLIFILIYVFITYINFRGNYIEYKELGEKYLNTFLKREKIRYRNSWRDYSFKESGDW